MQQLLKDICFENGLVFKEYKVISGGDINQAYGVQTSSGPVFLKMNDADRYPGLFKKEAEGLEALRQPGSLKVPRVLANGVVNGFQYLILEHLKPAKTGSSFWNDFATGLCHQHRVTSGYFGWQSSNYIGSLEQHNTPCKSWPDFYFTQRIFPLCRLLVDEKKFTAVDLQLSERFGNCLKEVFPTEPPALLHGDLWAGNFMAVQNSEQKEQTVACVYDPAVYYGHREMDLGMSLLFGGFDQRFYDCYNSQFPLEKNWRKRVPLTQLYPLLVHAALFGGHYIGRCKEIIQSYR